MSRLAHQAEILKLARLLDCSPDELELLAEVDAATLHQLREQAEHAFHASDGPFFKRITAASRLLPVPALALIAETVLGPLLAARIATQMDVDRGVGIAKRLPTKFLAEVCLRLDPKPAAGLIRAIPVQQIVKVAKALVKQDEHITMGRFVDIITDEAIDAVLAEIDDIDVLRTAFFAENKRRLDAIVERLPEERLISIIHCAASDADHWPEALGLMQHLSPAACGRLGDLAANLEEAVLSSMVHSIEGHDLWSDTLPLVQHMSPDSQARFANLPRIQQSETLQRVVDEANREDLWPTLLPLVSMMEEPGQKRCAELTETLDGEQLLHIASVATEHALWPPVFDLIQHMQPAQQRDILALMGMAPARVVDSLVPAIDQAGAWPLLNEAWPQMNSGSQARFRKAATQAGFSEHLPAE